MCKEHSRLLWTIVVIVIICRLGGVASAQSATATFSGLVVDERGAVVADAAVTATSGSTGWRRQAATNGDGMFIFPLLLPGRYTVTVRYPGFATLEVRNLVLEVGDQKALKFNLRVSQIGDSITIVEADNSIRDSGAVGTVINQQFIENIPLNGRSFQSLIELTPGTVLTVTSDVSQGQFSVNGQRANTNYFTIDGVSANVAASAGTIISQTGNGSLPSMTAFGSTSNLVSLDALQEFKVLTSTYTAEYGRTPGGQITLVTRSGTNDFHGTLFNYFRNDTLDANDWFVNALGLDKPALRQNDFGGTIGGPLILPRLRKSGPQPWYHGRDRTFFFFSYEGLRLRQPRIGITQVPGESIRQQAPQSVRQYLDLFPQPTGPENTETGLAGFNASYSNPSSLNATSLRLDHTLRNGSTIFGRYNHAPSETTARRPFGAYSLNTLNPINSITRTITLGHTLIAGPRLSNELRFNDSRVRSRSALLIDGFGGAQVPALTSLLPSAVSPQTSQFSLTVNTGFYTGVAFGNNVWNEQRQINFVDNLTKVIGAHSFKFGVDYRRLNPLIGSLEYGQTLDFTDLATLGAGQATAATITSGTTAREPVFTNLSLYGQDVWHLTPRLTFTYGLRWELNPPPTEANGNQAFTVTGLDHPETLALAPRGTPLYRTAYNNLAPRGAISYQLSQSPGRETVIRGGAGIFYDLATGQISEAYRFGSFGFGSIRRLYDVSFPLETLMVNPPQVSMDPPYGGNFTVADPDLKLPYTVQWNLALEQSFGSGQTISFTYVGSAGHRLLRGEVLLAPNPDFTSEDTSIMVIRNNASSDYHALQLQYQRRLSRGLQALVSYTWAHSIDDISSDNVDSFPTPGMLTPPRQDRGASDFDVRHNFSAAVTYDLPIHPSRRIARALLGNWSVDTIVKARSATPVDVGGKFVLNGGFVYLTRPDLVAGVPIYLRDDSAPGGRVLNPAAFAIPAEDRQGTLGRNMVRGFPFFQTDLTLRRRFRLNDQVNLTLRTDFFNLFNHSNFGNPVALLADPTNFGRSTAMLGSSLGKGDIDGGFNPLYQSGGPRSIQLSLKLQF
ncbi:MAG TPA: TonB-dependent receptor [Blastocatellia bacterium]|nr:TonB-dependent receptor [Blastocatellia bacterium]